MHKWRKNHARMLALDLDDLELRNDRPPDFLRIDRISRAPFRLEEDHRETDRKRRIFLERLWKYRNAIRGSSLVLLLFRLAIVLILPLMFA